MLKSELDKPPWKQVIIIPFLLENLFKLPFHPPRLSVHPSVFRLICHPLGVPFGGANPPNFSATLVSPALGATTKILIA